MKKLNLIIAVLFISGSCLAQSASKIALTKGSHYEVKEVVKTHSVTEAMGQEMETDMDINSTYKISVDDATGGKYKLTSTITNIKMKASMMGQEMEYDSDAPDQSVPFAGAIGEAINKPQAVVLDEGGKVIDQDGADEASEVLAQLKSSGSGTQAAFLALPAGVKVGDSFDVSRTDEGTGSTTAVKYSVKSIAGNMATLSFSGTVKVEKTVENQGMEILTKSEGTVDGETIVNTKTGEVQSTKSTSKTTGVVSVMGQDMPMTAEATSEVTVTKVN